jgi:hypothetical protein
MITLALQGMCTEIQEPEMTITEGRRVRAA